MKRLNILLAAVMVTLSFTVGAQSTENLKTDTVRVWGNCESCETKIEKAAKAAGASNAKWDPESKILSVSYNSSRSSLSKIEKSIAAAGYDTASENASDSSYNKLHKCCQYQRKPADRID